MFTIIIHHKKDRKVGRNPGQWVCVFKCACECVCVCTWARVSMEVSCWEKGGNLKKQGAEQEEGGRDFRKS